MKGFRLFSLVHVLAQQGTTGFEFVADVVADGREVDENVHVTFEEVLKEVVERCGVLLCIWCILAVTKKLGRFRNSITMLTSVVELGGVVDGGHGSVWSSVVS